MFLFKVVESFMITGRGLVLLPGLGNKSASVGDAIKIIRPHQTVIKATIKGIGFNEFRDIYVGTDLAKEDVPIGSEIWSNKG